MTPAGNLLLSLPNDDRLALISPEGDFLQFIGEFGVGDGEFSGPWGIAVDSEGAVYVAELGNQRLQRLNTDGTQDVWDLVLPAFPSGIAAKAGGPIYATFAANDSNHFYLVHRLDQDGIIQYAWGPDGDGDDGFGTEVNVAIGDDDAVYVLDQRNRQLYRFEDGGVGNVQQSWVVGSPGVDPGEFRQPWGLAIRNGRIYVADMAGRRVQVLSTTDGSYLFEWTTRDSTGRAWFPSGVAVGADGLIYVADTFSLYTFAVNVS